MRRRAVAQHLDPLDRRDRNRIQVDGRRTAPDRAVDVDQRRRMAPLRIDEHQRLIGREPAQCSRPDVIGAVGDRGSREVQRWRGDRECLRELRRTLRSERLARYDIDRSERVEPRTLLHARAGHDDFAQGIFVARWVLGRSQARRAGGRKREETQRAARGGIPDMHDETSLMVVRPSVARSLRTRNYSARTREFA